MSNKRIKEKDNLSIHTLIISTSFIQKIFIKANEKKNNEHPRSAMLKRPWLWREQFRSRCDAM